MFANIYSLAKTTNERVIGYMWIIDQKALILVKLGVFPILKNLFVGESIPLLKALYEGFYAVRTLQGNSVD